MILGEQAEWALHCVAFLAKLPPGSYIPGRHLAEFHDIPRAYLAKALQALSAAGLLESIPGPAGGYSLARSADRITLLEVIEALDSNRSTFRCTEIRKKGPCAGGSYGPVCEIAAAMYKADSAWRGALAGQTIQDINDRVFGTGHISNESAWVNRVEQWLEGKLNYPGSDGHS